MVETMHGDSRGMNPVAMTLVNPRKEYWPSRGSNKRPLVLKSCALPIEPWGSAQIDEPTMHTGATVNRRETKIW